MKFLPALGLLFIALKLTNIIDWSWWLVMLPIYGGAIVALVFYAIAFVAYCIGRKP